MNKQWTKRGFDPNWEVEMLNKVLFYIKEEYDEEIYRKITTMKFNSILTGYVFNCLSMRQPEKYTIPYMSQTLVNYVRKSY
jgi:hypothetical protein